MRNSNTEKSELTLQDIGQTFRNWFRFIWSKWLLILIIGLLGGTIGLLYAWFSTPKYTGNLTFVLSSGESSGLASLAGQFGFNLGMGSNDVFEGENIIELLKSRRIVKAALFHPMPDDSSTTLFQYIIDKTKTAESWAKEEDLKGIFPFPKDPAKLTPVQDSLVSEVHEALLEYNLSIDKPDPKLGIFRVSTNSANEKISCYLTKGVVDEASRFYIQTKTKTAKESLDMLQNEADSLRQLLGGTIVSTARESDKTFNLNPAYQVERAAAQQGQFRATVLATAYGEVVKNLEIAKINLQRETPLYQIIDSPTLPLKMEKPSRLISAIVGGIIAGFLILLYFTIKFIISINYPSRKDSDQTAVQKVVHPT